VTGSAESAGWLETLLRGPFKAPGPGARAIALLDRDAGRKQLMSLMQALRK